jgi:hypothetical protein
MKFAVLTNQARAARRPPYRIPGVNAAVLARLFPGLKKRAPRGKQTRSARSIPAVQQNGQKGPPAQLPLQAPGAPNRTSPTIHVRENGKAQGSPLNGNTITLPRPVEKQEPVPGPRKSPTRPGGPEKKSPPAPPATPALQTPRNEPPKPQETPQRQETPTTPEPPARPAAPAPRPPQREEPARPDPLRAARSALGLQRLFQQHPDLPGQSIVLGVCEDGFPLVLDLFDPGPGALLSIGDDRESQLALLRNAIDSAASRCSPRQLQFLVVSHQPQAWRAWVKDRGFQRHCLAVAGADDESVHEWLLRLADWTEQRRQGQLSGPPVLLVMDTLSFLSRLAYDVRLNFDWMVKESPPAQIWPLAAVSTELASSLGQRALRVFQSRILGFSRDTLVFTQLAGISEQEASYFGEPGRFAVRVGESWIHFHLPA